MSIIEESLRAPGSFESLIGKVILKVFVTAIMDHKNQSIKFLTDQGLISFYCDADCCSSSWFHDVSGVDNLIGRKVLATSDIEMPDFENSPDAFDHERYIRLYGSKIYSDLGECFIEMRNESNGYYGGRIVSDPEDIWDYSCSKEEEEKNKLHDPNELIEIHNEWRFLG